jgi:hypothetical protein
MWGIVGTCQLELDHSINYSYRMRVSAIASLAALASLLKCDAAASSAVPPWDFFSLADCAAGRVSVLRNGTAGLRLVAPHWQAPSMSAVWVRPFDAMIELIAPAAFLWADVRVNFFDSKGSRLPDEDILVAAGTSGAVVRAALGAAADASTRERGGLAALLQSRLRVMLKQFAAIVIDPLGLLSEITSSIREQVSIATVPVAENARTVLEGAAEFLRTSERDMPGPEGWPTAAAAALEAASASITDVMKPALPPHAHLNPLEGGFAGAIRVAHSDNAPFVVSVQCTLDHVSIRFPAALASGILLAIYADDLSSSRVFLYGTGAAAGATLVVLILIIAIVRFVRGKGTSLNVAFAAFAGISAVANAWRDTLRNVFADLPFAFIFDNWGLSLLIVALVGALSTVWCCAASRAEENVMTRIYVSAALRLFSAACLYSASQSHSLGIVMAVAAVGGPLGGVYAVWWFCGAILRAAAAPEILIEFLVKWTFGWFFETPRFLLIRALRIKMGCARDSSSMQIKSPQVVPSASLSARPAPAPFESETAGPAPETWAAAQRGPAAFAAPSSFRPGVPGPAYSFARPSPPPDLDSFIPPELAQRVQRAVSRARMSEAYAGGMDPPSPTAQDEVQAIGAAIAQHVVKLLSPVAAPSPAPSPRYSVPAPPVGARPRAASVAANVAANFARTPPAPSAPHW